MIDEDDEEDSEVRLVVPNMEVNGMQLAVAPDVQDQVLNEEIWRVRLRSVSGIEPEFVGNVCNESLNEVVDALYRFGREWDPGQISTFHVRDMDVEAQRGLLAG
jgi:hypothetical protein